MTSYYDTLVISGGSTKGLSALGTLQYCYDNNILEDIKNYMGTSSGSATAYLLSIGWVPKDIIAYLCTHDVLSIKIDSLSLVNIINSNNGGLDYSLIEKHLEAMTIDKIGSYVTFKDIKEKFGKNLVIPVYNWTKKQGEYLSYETTPDMPCLIAVRMSCALPFIFTPVKYMNSYYIDGGIFDNFPITYKLKENNVSNHVKSHRLGICVTKSSKKTEKTPHEVGMFKYMVDILNILIDSRSNVKHDTYQNIDIIDIDNEVNIINFSIKAKDIMELYSIGYKKGRDFFDCNI
jgi:NTE family protein